METHNNIPAFYAKNRTAWRRWLEKNQDVVKAVWLIMYHKSSLVKTVLYEEAVEEAICFGWIDSVAHKRDAESKYQFFAKRKPKSNWSKANRERAEKMIEKGLMQANGKSMVDLAKKTGTWDALLDIQNAVIPADLQVLLNKNKKALDNFLAFAPSSKRIILEWIFNAKRPETRLKRMIETVRLAKDNIKANHYRQ